MSSFLEEVIEGLSQPQKRIPPKYFYDERGDALFQKIMNLDEYYLPRCELEIIQQQSDEISKLIHKDLNEIELIELGAGDGSKTISLLKALQREGLRIIYVPLDISANVLEINRQNMISELPEIEVKPIAGDYFKTFPTFSHDGEPKRVMFMGSNIGNYTEERALEFLSMLKANLVIGDYILIAFDLKKHPKTILKAYNDPQGITASFNLNLLSRINIELGADINIPMFEHYATYNPISGDAMSFLVSLEDQTITISNRSFRLNKGESIHTEISRKYDLSDIENLASKANLHVERHFLDDQKFYSLSLFRVE